MLLNSSSSSSTGPLMYLVDRPAGVATMIAGQLPSGNGGIFPDLWLRVSIHTQKNINFKIKMTFWRLTLLYYSLPLLAYRQQLNNPISEVNRRFQSPCGRSEHTTPCWELILMPRGSVCEQLTRSEPSICQREAASTKEFCQIQFLRQLWRCCSPGGFLGCCCSECKSQTPCPMPLEPHRAARSDSVVEIWLVLRRANRNWSLTLTLPLFAGFAGPDDVLLVLQSATGSHFFAQTAATAIGSSNF